MRVFVWLDSQYASLAVFNNRDEIVTVFDVAYYPDKGVGNGAFPKREIRNAYKIAQELSKVVCSLLVQQCGPLDEKVSFWICDPNRLKLTVTERTTRHVMSGYLFGQVENLGNHGYLEAPARLGLPVEVYRRRVFHTLSRDEVDLFLLEEASDGLIEALGLGLSYTKRFRAHAALTGIA